MSLKDNLMQAAMDLANAPAENRTETKAAKPERPASEFMRPHTDTEKRGYVTEIGAETVIEGSVRTNGSLVLYGAVHGNITGQGDLSICGRIEGDAEGKNIRLSGVRMTGNVTAHGTLDIDERSAVEGDVHAESFVLNGAVKGNVIVAGTLTMEQHAVITGGVTAGELSVVEGAVISGEVRIGVPETAE